MTIWRREVNPIRHAGAIFAALALAFLAVACTSVEGGGLSAEAPVEAPPAPEPGAPHTPVVLELFTSQGCSSCPPADAVLSRLGHDAKLKGRVVPLAFHVDYWNYIGWADPFSAKGWTDRQYQYAGVWKHDQVYTPQLVVNGHAEMNGADEDRILGEIASAETGPAGRVTLVVAPNGAHKLDVDVCAETPQRIDASQLEAVVAVFENGVTTEVRRGENSGRRLVNDFIVRRLERAFSFSPEAGAKQQGRVTVELDPSWNAANVGVVAFLQDPRTLRIYGAAAP